MWCQLNPADWSSIGLWGPNSCRTETAATAGAVDCSTIFHFASQSHTFIVPTSTLQRSLLKRDQRSLVWTLRSAFARPTRDTNYIINVCKCIVMANQIICLFIEKCDGVISQCHNLLRRMTCRSKAGRKSILDCVAPKPGWQIFGCAPLCRWVSHSDIPLYSGCWNIDDILVGQITSRWDQIIQVGI